MTIFRKHVKIGLGEVSGVVELNCGFSRGGSSAQKDGWTLLTMSDTLLWTMV